MQHPIFDHICVVSSLECMGACAQHGMRVGDVIERVNGSLLCKVPSTEESC